MAGIWRQISFGMEKKSKKKQKTKVKEDFVKKLIYDYSPKYKESRCEYMNIYRSLKKTLTGTRTKSSEWFEIYNEK